jgi:hypothetical protein
MLGSMKRAQPPRPSDWTFETSNGGGLSLGLFGGEGGSITLAEPKTKRPVVFYYGALGVGFSGGFKLPKIGRAQLPGLTGSSRAFPSFGQVYMSGHFEKAELAVDDINGGCCFLEVALGAAWGGAGYAMVFGMNVAQFARMLLAPPAPGLEQSDTSTGMLLFAGANFGLQAGGGLTSFTGVLRAG